MEAINSELSSRSQDVRHCVTLQALSSVTGNASPALVPLTISQSVPHAVPEALEPDDWVVECLTPGGRSAVKANAELPAWPPIRDQRLAAVAVSAE